MVLSDTIIDDIKQKSGLPFDQSKHFEMLSEVIFSKTGRTIGLTTLKRLLGYITDSRKSNPYTLNTIAIYLGFETWEEYIKTKRFDSTWDYEDDSIYVDELVEGQKVSVEYLNRKVTFVAKIRDGENILVVESVENSSLTPGDECYIYRIKKGECLEAKKVIRNGKFGNYKTNGEVKNITIE